MFGSTVLNVVIGLVFIYLLYSLLASILQEFISTWFGLRASVLRKGISRMLDDQANANGVSTAFYEHPLIKFLGENKLHKEPAYLTAQNFSKVLIDLLRGANVQPGQNFATMIQQSLNTNQTQWGPAVIDPQTLSYLRSLWADAQGDVDKFRSSLEQWYDDTMERVSGWYKRKIQMILLGIGMALAIAFNVDSIQIAEKLSKDPKLAAQFANNAAVYIQTHKELASQLSDTGKSAVVDKQHLKTQMDTMMARSGQLMDSANAIVQGSITDANQLLGLGWGCKGKSKPPKYNICICDNFHWHSIIGWFITALAISLGAPFWFDLLNKLMKVRSSVATTSTDDKSQNDSKTQKIKTVG